MSRLLTVILVLGTLLTGMMVAGRGIETLTLREVSPFSRPSYRQGELRIQALGEQYRLDLHALAAEARRCILTLENRLTNPAE
jgi:hypothetical protein